MIDLKQGNCLELMKDIPDKSVDMILADLPYGTTANKWDSIISMNDLWNNYRRVIKENGVIALFGQEPFSSSLRISNINEYRYDWVWDKTRGTNFALSHYMPMKSTENISIFYKSKPCYHPQFWYSYPYEIKSSIRKNNIKGLTGSAASVRPNTKSTGKRYPLNLIRFKRDSKKVHPTQKPVKLLEYLIKTYTNEGEMVLDNTMGSGSTGVAAVNLNRSFIGYELEQDYFDIATERINEAIKDHE